MFRSFFLPILVTILSLCGCAQPQPVTLHGQAMGTSWHLKAAAPAQRVGELQHLVEERLAKLTAQMSAWEPESDLSRFNRAQAGTWHALPDELFRVIAHAHELARDTDGAFDPTLAPLVALWGFGPDGAARTVPPSIVEIEQAKAQIGWHKIQLRPATRELFQPGSLSLDINALGPGFAVDEIGRALQQAGEEDFLFELGGEMLASGLRPDGEPWRVAVERPDQHEDDAQFDTVVALHEAAIGSSGDYRVGFEHEGRRYSHTLDPRSGEPVQHAAAAVSVVAKSAMQADALAAALMVLGPEEGLRFAEQRGIAAVFTLRDEAGGNRRIATPAFEQVRAK